jgi:NDP-sugar pyrophosphorylase family protein
LLNATDFFDLDSFEHAALFERITNVWEALPRIKPYLEAYFERRGRQILGEVEPGAFLDDGSVFLGEGSVVEAGAYIVGPTYIGRNTVIRHGAYIRGNVVTGDHCIVGHASEAKNVIMLNGSCIPHFAYVGDSILGNRVNLGAGTRLSNLTVVSVKDPITGKRPTLKITIGDVLYDTGLAKFGAIIGDDAQTGCNTVTNPGCLIGPRTLVYPNVSLRKGYYPPDSIVKLRQVLEVVQRQ